MKTNVILSLLFLVVALFLIGLVAEYANAYDSSTNCRMKWGEMIGIGCRVPVAKTVSAVEETAQDLTAAYKPTANCRSRWGEPVGIGCRAPVQEMAGAKEYPQELPAAYKVPTNCRSRWGEPIGIGCR